MLLAGASTAAEPERFDEKIVVVGNASLVGRQGGLGSGSVIEEETIELTRATHPNELLVRVPGAWVSRGSGQEHLTAIRSPVFTGAGACGEFLFLENGVPIRPAGFCNVNNLFEVNTEQARQLEVLRGPGSAQFGGNAVHGAVNALSPIAEVPWRLSLEGGPDEFVQLRASGSGEAGEQLLRLDAFGTHTDGYRDDTGFDEQKLLLTQLGPVGDWQVHTTLSATNLEQDTGGFVRGYKAYKDSYLRKTNPNPEAYRDAWSVRLVSEWARKLGNGAELALTPYLRRSEMDFLMHFLPGQPREENGQKSAGLVAALADEADRFDWRIGAQLEWADGYLEQFQVGPDVGTSRPQGLHYDYDVTSLMAAAFGDVRVDLTPRLGWVTSLRAEWLEYDYDNKALDGNTRDDGTPCEGSGCLYNRPADREDDFTNVAGRTGLVLEIRDGVDGFAMISNGFRPPQATELYRLQRDQNVADLDSEEINGGEIGARGLIAAIDFEVVGFVEKSDNVIFRDSLGFNVSDGKTKSAGLELALGWQINEQQRISAVGSYARHEYDFDRQIAGGEVILDGNDVDTAPRWMGSAHWSFKPTPAIDSELEFIYLDEYFLNAANTAEYAGHVLWNWRGQWRVNGRFALFARVMNLLDKKVADRADFAFGSYRYFPALPRQLYAGVEVTF